MPQKVTTVEQVMARLAGRAKGVVTRVELLRAGVSHDEIRARLECGSLLPQYRGVYRVGHRAPSVEARYMAAVKACGDGAALSGRAAAYWLGLAKGLAPAPEVTASGKRVVPGLATRRAKRLNRITWKGIPTTTVPDTLIALAASSTANELARACHEAGVLHKTTPGQVRKAMKRNTPGAAALRRVLDGYRFHNSRYSWEQDRRREREARNRGDDFRRYTWSDVFERPREMIRGLGELLLSRR